MNSLIRTFFEAKVFNLNITSKDIPDNIPFKLNSKFFAFMIPGINDKYNNKDLRLLFEFASKPVFIFDQNTQSVNFNSSGTVSLSLVDSQSPIFSFEAGLEFQILVGADVADSNIHFLIGKFEISEMKTISSEFSVKIEELKQNFNFLFKLIFDAANKFYLVNGIPIPEFQGLKFKKASILVKETFLTFTLQADKAKSRFNWIRLY